MPHANSQTLFLALGYVMSFLQNEKSVADMPQRARDLAQSVESFCRLERPEYLDEGEFERFQTDVLIDRIKETLKMRGDTRLPEDREELIRIHRRLEVRAGDKVRKQCSTDELADLILPFIDAEIEEDVATLHEEQKHRSKKKQFQMEVI